MNRYLLLGALLCAMMTPSLAAQKLTLPEEYPMPPGCELLRGNPAEQQFELTCKERLPDRIEGWTLVHTERDPNRQDMREWHLRSDDTVSLIEFAECSDGVCKPPTIEIVDFGVCPL